MGNTTTCHASNDISKSNVVEVKFDSNSPSFDNYVMFNTPTSINTMDLQLGGAKRKGLKTINSKKIKLDSDNNLSSFGLNDNQINSINKYFDIVDSEAAVNTPQSSDLA